MQELIPEDWKEKELNLQILPSGIYFLKIQTGKSISMRKVILQKDIK